MISMRVPYIIRSKCVELNGQGKSNREIFDEFFHIQFPDMCYETFRRRLCDWKKKPVDEETLKAGTYSGFYAHGATVQVDGEGNIRQAWIKQTANDVDWNEIVDILKDNIRPIRLEEHIQEKSEYMLEIPLFDMHFGVATKETYANVLQEIIDIIRSKYYDEINIIFGQDVLHNNDLRGHTAKGTPIDKVDFKKAFEDALDFYLTILTEAISHSSRVNMIYSKGNHDECTAWCLFKALEIAFPDVHFDDSFKPRKCISWKEIFIGIGHCEYTNKSEKLFQDFVFEFPKQFAKAKTREIHTGHLHRESLDEGVFVRRLASAVPTDNWSSDNGFIGAHKRFQIFEWTKNRLRSIYYVQ